MTSPAAEEFADAFRVELPPRPYPGLRPFKSAEWPVFFGREAMSDEVIARILAKRFLVVHGDSGCGKSSLIYAGVLPHLQQQTARSGVLWRTCAALPGEEPLWSLAKALALLDGSDETQQRETEIRRTLNFGRKGAAALMTLLGADSNNQVCILLDQFEELFAHARHHGAQEASLLIELLIGIHEQAAPGLCVVLTMRSEFLGNCANYPGFAEVVNATQYLLPQMQYADLVRAIREPATLYNGEVSQDLAERLIADAAATRDPLPLIQHGLMQLHRNFVVLAGEATDAPWKLTLDVYLSSERNLCDFLSSHADTVAEHVAHGRAIEDLFRALTDIDSDGHAVRRPQTFAQLVAVTGTPAQELQKILAAFRADGVSFLRPYGPEPLVLRDRVDVSHEALIRSWAKIADPSDGWLIREFRSGLIWRSLLVQADSFDLDRSKVLSPAAAEERATWLLGRNPHWSERYGGGWERVQALIQASVTERDRRMEEDARQRSRAEEARMREYRLEQKVRTIHKIRGALVTAIAFAVALMVMTVFAFRALKQAEKARDFERKAHSEAEYQRQLAETESERNRTAREQSEQARRKQQDAVSALQTQLADLSKAMAASHTSGALRNQIDQVQANIEQQLGRLSVSVAEPPRVYVQISEEGQRNAASQLALLLERSKLGSNTIVVPGIEVKHADVNAFRCFSTADCESSGPLLGLINSLLRSPQLEYQDLTQTPYGRKANVKPKTYEIWFAPGTLSMASVGASLHKAAAADARVENFELSPAALDFGKWAIAEPAAQRDLKITNGSNSLWAVSFSISGNYAHDFSIEGCQTVAPHTICPVQVEFTPSRAVEEQAVLTAQATTAPEGAREVLQVALTGTGLPWSFGLQAWAERSGTKEAATFGGTIVGSTLQLDVDDVSSHPTLTTQLTNPLDHNVRVATDSGNLLSLPTKPFRVTDQCDGVLLPPHGTCSISIAISRKTNATESAGAEIDGKVLIWDADDPDKFTRATVMINGTASAAPPKVQDTPGGSD